MPELPEVESVRRGLEHTIAGETITRVEVLHPRPVRDHPVGPEGFVADLTGRTIAIKQNYAPSASQTHLEQVRSLLSLLFCLTDFSDHSTPSAGVQLVCVCSLWGEVSIRLGDGTLNPNVPWRQPKCTTLSTRLRHPINLTDSTQSG